MLFRKKPVIIDALKYTGNNGWEISNWSKNKVIESPVLEPTKDNPTGCYLQIETLEGVMIAIVNDWIIKGIKGEFYPCKPDIFEQTYESPNCAGNIEPVWVDKPDSEGWWWYQSKYIKGIDCLYVFQYRGSWSTEVNNEITDVVIYAEGKWCKAIVPEYKE